MAVAIPIAVAADESEFQKNESRVVLEGSVAITQGVLTLFADEVTVNYHSGDTRDKGTQGTITSLVAKGTVKFECEGDRAHGCVAVYDVSQHHIKLTGDVLLVRDNNILKGETLFIDARCMTMASGTSPATTGATFSGVTTETNPTPERTAAIAAIPMAPE